ncbi:MAG TPA: Lrp/AsnC family transcriptional regulator [Gammaproteobacteria bacterium]|nr:Lrp/AsnC family transcriptional regulator [Gammaproteobacteria bacterium]
MDKSDYKILSALQANGRLSSQALAEKAGLSTSPCWRRLRKLETAGVISANVAILDPEKVGLHVIAIANISLEDHHPDSVSEFDRMVAERPEILECYAMSGQYDFLLKVICESIGAYDRLLGQHILQCKAVHTVNTSFVMRRIKATTALPLPM